MSLDCTGLMTKSPSSCRTGSWQRWHKLSHGRGHLVPGNVRSGKETWLVWVLSGPSDFLPFKICCSVYTLCLFAINVGLKTCFGVVHSRRTEGELFFFSRAEGALNCFSVPS